MGIKMLLIVTGILLFADSGRRASAIVVPPTDVARHSFRCGPCLCSGQAPVVDCSSLGLTSVPGDIPTAARILVLRNNTLRLSAGGFQRLGGLQQLDLSLNKLETIPGDAFSNLSRLESLDLSYNNITFVLGKEGRPFRGLESLLLLNLSNNVISDFPPSVLEDLKENLMLLNLSHNSLGYNGSTAWTISVLENLTSLDLSHNKISVVSRGMFRSPLQSLDLSFNNIPYNETIFAGDAFENVSVTLSVLNIQGNCNTSKFDDLDYPHNSLSKLINLQSLWMDGLHNKSLGPGFKHLKNLSNLSFFARWGTGICNMQKVLNDTFVSLSGAVKTLNLCSCNISSIELNALAPFRDSLKTLDLSHNRDLGFKNVNTALYGLQHSVLETLYIDSIVDSFSICMMVTAEDTANYRNTNITTICARNNRIEQFCTDALRNMPKSLQTVVLYGNNFGFGRYLKDLQYLEGLRYLEADGHRRASYPPKYFPKVDPTQCSMSRFRDSVSRKLPCSGTGDPHPKYVPASPQRHDEVYPEEEEELANYTLPPNLTTFISRYNQLFFRLESLVFHRDNQLGILSLDSNLLVTWSGKIQGLEKVEFLNLSNNLAIEATKDFFSSFPSLKELYLARNFLREAIAGDEQGDLFESLEHLEVLDLSHNYISKLPDPLLRGMRSLQTLNLSNNVLDTFDVNISHLVNLSNIHLAYNGIKFLPQSVMDHLDAVAERLEAQNLTVVLDISVNPLACTCEHLDFLSWMETSKVNLYSPGSYSCVLADGNLHKNVHILEVIRDLRSSCANKMGYFLASFSCLFCLLLVLISAVLYRFRWKLRYLYYASRLAYRRLDAGSREFRHDAFVSYSARDGHFVHHELLEQLEQRAGLRLLVHNRDFTPGRAIPSNIVEAVQSSRRTLVVLSKELMGSKWCRYELQMATMEAAYSGRDVLLFLIYEDVPLEQMSLEVLYNLQSSTYIQYPAQGDQQMRRDFWDRLAQAIRQ